MIDLEMTSCIARIIFTIMSVWDREREYIPNDTSVHSRLYSVIHSIMSANVCIPSSLFNITL